MSRTLSTEMCQATLLCSRCKDLFTDSHSLKRLNREDVVQHGRFSDLASRCSLCSLVKRRFMDVALDGGLELDPSTENGKVALSLMFQDSDLNEDDNVSEHYVDQRDTSGFEHGTPSALVYWLHDETSGESRISADLAWYSIPAPVLSVLGFDLAGAEAVSHWNKVPGFYISEYWNDPGFIRQIADAVDECRKNHKKCGAKNLGVLPGMVLDVSASGTSGRVFLREPDQQERGDYIALSYCWGGPQKVVTEMANRAEHQRRGIELSHLPRTIADAARVTANLGIRYLWVDALCIVQDDHTSKALEIEKMGDIYTNATLVLVAGGVARRADDGFLQVRDEFAVVPIRAGESFPEVWVCLAPGDLEASHIDSRGWTFQERHLASRTLEFRGSRGVSLNCQESFITYVGGANPDGTDAWESDERKLSEKLVVRANARGLWQAMLDEYTVRRLTDTGDRLPALAGFARMWAKESSSSPGKYMAGLWEGQLVDDLMWRSGVQHIDSDVRISLDHYRKPGWSWISVLDHDEPEMLKAGSFITNPQRIRTRLGGYDENKASLVRHSISLAHSSAPFGRVLGGEVTLRAQVAPIPKNLGCEKDRGRWEAILRSCDYQLSAPDAGRLLLLRLKIGRQWDPLTSRVQHGDGGLLILPCGQDSSICRRVGCFWDWVDAEDEAPLVDWDAISFRETTLI